MKIFSLNPSNTNGEIVITEGASLSSFKINSGETEKTLYGLDIGYFRNEYEKQPEERVRKYFLIHNHIGLTDFVNYITPCYKGEKKKFQQGWAVGKAESEDQCIVYLCNLNPRVRAKFQNARQYSLDNLLVSGCIRSDKIMTTKDGKTIQDECQPSVLILKKDTECVVSFFDITTKTNRLLTIKYNGNDLDIISNIERQKNAKKDAIKFVSSFAEAFSDFYEKKDNRRNKRKERFDKFESSKWN